MPSEILKNWKNYIPQDKLIPTNISGLQNPKNIGDVEYTKEMAKFQAQQAQDEYNYNVLKNSGLVKGTFKEYLDKGLTFPQIAEFAKTKKEIFDDPTFAANLINKFVIPAAEKYNEYFPAKEGFENLSTQFSQKVLPYSFIEHGGELQNYDDMLNAMKSLIAKGITMQVGNLTEKEAKDPLKMFPKSSDLPYNRSTKMNMLKSLMQSYGVE